MISKTRLNAMIGRCRQAIDRSRLVGREFSIISNNCWGAHVYQSLRREFSTPFVGLFLSPSSYVRMLQSFRKCLSARLEFKPTSDENWINLLRDTHPTRWPIGSLGEGIEIQFMHYQTEAEAFEKWTRRVARVTPNPDQWFFKFDDRDGCTSEQMLLFEHLPFRNKVFFTTRADCSMRCAVRIHLEEPCVPDGLILSRLSPAYLDTVDWLRGGTGRVKWWTKLASRV